MRNPRKIGYLVEEENEVVFVEDSRGSLRIYEFPGNDKAVIGSDVAEGVENDQSASIALGINTNATLAAFNSGRIDPDEFAIFNKRLGLYYNRAFIGVERNNQGFSVVSDLIKIYPTQYIYFNYRLDEKTKKKTKKFGWITNEQTRHLILAAFKKEIREASTELNDKQLIQQCMKFVNNEGFPEAAEGELDDLVIARAIAGQMRRYRLASMPGDRKFVPNAEPVY